MAFEMLKRLMAIIAFIQRFARSSGKSAYEFGIGTVAFGARYSIVLKKCERVVTA
jgi:hypothetical protein